MSDPRRDALVRSVLPANWSVSRFNTYLLSHKASPQTIQRYLPTAREFIRFTGKEDGWSKDDVRTYLAGKSERDLKGSYLRFLFGALKALFRAHDLAWPFEKQDLPVLNEPEVKVYEYREVDRILNVAAEMVSDATASPTGESRQSAFMIALRNFLLLKICAVTGCRSFVLTLFNREDYDPVGGRLFIRPGKHGRPGWRKLDRETVKWLNHYLHMRTDRHQPLFITVRHQGERRMDEKTLNAVLETVCRRARVENHGWHAFRRGLVTDLYNRGVREKDITLYIGWRKPEQVFRYIHRLPKQVEDAIEKANPYFDK